MKINIKKYQNYSDINIPDKGTFIIGFENNFSNETVEFFKSEKNVLRIMQFCKSHSVFSQKLNKRSLNDVENAIIVINTDIDDDVLKPIVKLFDLIAKLGVDINIDVYTKSENEDLNIMVKALSAPTRYERIEIIYNYLCDELDRKFIEKDYCKFCGGKCLYNRKKYAKQKIMGCCESFKVKFCFITDVKLCEHLSETGCTVKNLGCKLFTCNDLKRHGVIYKLDYMLLARVFFTKKERELIRTTFFVTKEEVIKKLTKV